MSKSSLPRCAVVNFRRDGDQVHVTPRAYRNNGGMACRVLKFEDAFQLEELSSRTFAFSKLGMRHRGAQYYDNDSCFDMSAAFNAVTEMGFEENAAPRPSRRTTWARRLSSVLRRTTFSASESKKRDSSAQPPHPWRSSSLGCVPMRRETNSPKDSNASMVKSRILRRRNARHEMQLFENGTVLAEPPRGKREWRFPRFRKNKQLPAPVSTPAPTPRKHRASIDSYVLYMDDEL